jgi:hypothetical protein
MEKLDFYHIKQRLIELSAELFSYKPKSIKKDIDLKGDFDFIGVDIHGVVSFSPEEQMEAEVLNYNRDEQGRDYFSSFLTLVIQSGVFLGKQQMQEKLDDLQERLDKEKALGNLYNKSLTKLQKNQMPEGTVEQEVVKLREELGAMRIENRNLRSFKNKVDLAIKSFS